MAVGKRAEATPKQRDQIFYTLEDSIREVRMERDRQALLDGAKIAAMKLGKSVGDFTWPSFNDMWRQWEYREERLDCVVYINYEVKYNPPGKNPEEKLMVFRMDGEGQVKIEATRTPLGIWKYHITSSLNELLRNESPIPS